MAAVVKADWPNHFLGNIRLPKLVALGCCFYALHVFGAKFLKKGSNSLPRINQLSFSQVRVNTNDLSELDSLKK